MAGPKSVALIMAGGSGTRFWPASRPDYPKQFLSLTGSKSLICETVERISALVPRDGIFICAAQSQRALLEEEVPEVSGLILEPLAKNTAACLMLSTIELLRRGVHLGTPMIALPADHHIENTAAFQAILTKAIDFATETHGLVTLGIEPTSPHTGYGYVEAIVSDDSSAQAWKVKRFVEKPNHERAEEFLRNKNFFWNSGIFVWTVGAIKAAFERWLPDSWRALSAYKDAADLQRIYASLESVPIDVAVMEKADNLYLVPAGNIGWSDVGSWDALYQLKSPRAGDNVILSGDVRPIQSQGCLVKVPPTKKVALVGVSDLIVVESDGVLLITHRSADQKVRDAAKAFEP